MFTLKKVNMLYSYLFHSFIAPFCHTKTMRLGHNVVQIKFKIPNYYLFLSVFTVSIYMYRRHAPLKVYLENLRMSKECSGFFLVKLALFYLTSME